MNRSLHILNFLGVLALAALCIIQWQNNRRLNLQSISQEKTRLEQIDQLAEKNKTVQGYIADLEEFRTRLAQSDESLKQAQQNLKSAAADRDRIARERDQQKTAADALKKNLEQWQAAVAARDQSLKQNQEQLQKLAADRNDAITKYNTLAARYNAAENQLKQAADQLQKLAADRNEAVAKFNALAEKYNALAANPAAVATKPASSPQFVPKP